VQPVGVINPPKAARSQTQHSYVHSFNLGMPLLKHETLTRHKKARCVEMEITMKTQKTVSVCVSENGAHMAKSSL
jgi:hypothetical protein